MGGGRGQRGTAEGGEEVEVEAEGEAARRPEEAAGEGKSVASGAEPAPALRFGTAAAGGKSRAAGGGTTEGGGRGERRSPGAGGGRRLGRTGAGEGGEAGETGRW